MINLEPKVTKKFAYYGTNVHDTGVSLSFSFSTFKKLDSDNYFKK
jgi:hypothetical protein